MDTQTQNNIQETVLEILKNSNMDETTEFQIRKAASEKLQMDLSDPTRKKFVREVVETYLRGKQAEEEQEEEEEDPEEEEEDPEEEEEEEKKKDGKEYDDEGGLIICRLSDRRRVTLSEFRGKTLISIREYYKKDGKELPSAKGISLSAEQWATFSKNVSGIEKAITKMEAR